MNLDNNSKIKSLEKIGEVLSPSRAEGGRIVLCHGTFDLLHPGHLRHLKEARELGDLLVVTITADRYVSKGPGRPAFNEQLRAESMAALVYVDYVCVVYEATGISAIEAVQPHLYVKGGEYREVGDDVTGNMLREKNAVEAGGGEIYYTGGITFSSSTLLNQHFSQFPQAVKDYLQKFKSVYGSRDVSEQIQSLEGLKVLVVGDTIIEEFCSVSSMGINSEDIANTACKYESIERFPGGAVEVANQIAAYVDGVTLLTGLGRGDPHEPMVRSKLAERITPAFFFFETAPTLVKRRFIDANHKKLFELYFYDADPVTPSLEDEICRWIAANAESFDAVIVPDYGNGFITEKIVEALANYAGFLAVNTQINAGNLGFHSINRYPRADYISLNGSEIRLAAHNNHASLQELAIKIGRDLKAGTFCINQDGEEVLLVDVDQATSTSAPSLSGSGNGQKSFSDSYFAIIALCLAKGGERELALFLAGAAQVLAGQESDSGFAGSVALHKFTTTLLK
ncbi:MAG: adenylyltransferase/cytidyltransferase family protein [Magnetococcales bacterium]|nr:adenylyltransferase/cytidyltransferase family protein [Magnetococcales bacterium]